MKLTLTCFALIIVNLLSAQSKPTKEMRVLSLEIKELDLKKELKEVELDKLTKEQSGYVYSENELTKFYATKDSLTDLLKQTRKELLNVRTAKEEDLNQYEIVNKKDEELTAEDIKRMSTRDLRNRKAKISSRIASNKLTIKMGNVSAAEKARLEILNTKLSMKLDLIRNELEHR